MASPRFRTDCAELNAGVGQKCSKPVTVGVISDTHGLVRPEAVEALRDSELIVHAGDVGTPEVLKQLRAIAPRSPCAGTYR